MLVEMKRELITVVRDGQIWREFKGGYISFYRNDEKITKEEYEKATDRWCAFDD